MMMRTLVPLMGLLFAAGLTAQDRIDLKTGRPIGGVKVLSESFDEVKIQPKGAGAVPRTLKASRVLDIFREGAPASYQEGRAALATGDLANAVRLLDLAVSETGTEKWVAEYASFYLGRAHARLGSHAKARQSFERVLTLKPDSRFLPAVRLAITESQIAEGQFAAAQTECEKFLQEISQKRLPTAYRLESNLLAARAFDGQKRYVEAAGAFQRVSQDARAESEKATDAEDKAELAEVALRAMADAGRSLVSGGKYAEADAAFAALAAQYPKDGRAQAHAEVGRAESALGRGDVDAAWISATKVVAISSAESVRPRAYLVAAKACKARADHGAQDGLRLYKDYLEELVERHPGSPEAAEAATLLGRRD